MRAHYNCLITGITLMAAAHGLRAQDITIVPCNGDTLIETYCYVNNDYQAWHWQSECSDYPIFLHFTSGTIAAGDLLVFYDGPDESAPILFENPWNTEDMDMTGLILVGTNNDVYAELISDSVNCCATGGLLGGGQSVWTWSASNGSSTTGINEEQAVNFTMYPNPASSELNLRMASPVNGTADLRILDVAGRVVYQNTFAPTGTELNTFDLRGLQSGIYSVVLRTPKGVKSRKLQVIR